MTAACRCGRRARAACRRRLPRSPLQRSRPHPPRSALRHRRSTPAARPAHPARGAPSAARGESGGIPPGSRTRGRSHRGGCRTASGQSDRRRARAARPGSRSRGSWQARGAGPRRRRTAWTIWRGACRRSIARARALPPSFRPGAKDGQPRCPQDLLARALPAARPWRREVPSILLAGSAPRRACPCGHARPRPSASSAVPDAR